MDISQSNQPKHQLLDPEQEAEMQMTDDEKIDFVAARILKEYRKAFEELAKGSDESGDLKERTENRTAK